ncbi:hypothetical protein BDF22DRAFT_701000 [Syncephalis plumigaleata]|nr:hypothetical protein BDF22DRAFT_701000 [Syncephalis plumigaleata]
MSMQQSTLTSFGERSRLHTNAVGSSLLSLMERKQTNLCVAADLTTKKELLALAEAVGPHICLFKTHIDIVRDFDQDLVDELTRLALEYDFLSLKIGVHRIVHWAHLIDAHTLPGDGIIRGLKQVDGARTYGFVVGFVTGKRLTNGEDKRDFIHFTPGVSLSSSGDALGQQYRTPRQAVLECGTDVVIVGRGIYGASNPNEEAKRYREEAWQAYLERIQQ